MGVFFSSNVTRKSIKENYERNYCIIERIMREKNNNNNNSYKKVRLICQVEQLIVNADLLET